MSNININDYITTGFLSKGENPVLKVQSIINKKEYALKKIKRSDLKSHLKDIQGLLHLVGCDHPNIIKILGFSVQQQKKENRQEFVLFILMECFEKNLETEIFERKNKNTYYTKDEFLNMLKELLSTFLFLQNQMKIAHRDIKPANILRSNQGNLLLCDFSESFAQTHQEARATSIVGTPYFMAPELRELYITSGFEDDKSYNPWKADVYSMGTTFLDCAFLSIAEKSDLKQKLLFLEKLYGKDVRDFIEICVLSEGKERMDFEELSKCQQYEKIFGKIKGEKEEKVMIFVL